MPFTMTKAEREQFLSDLHVGIISIARPGKGPLSVPIWYDYEPGGEVWMITGRDSLKGRLLREAERATLCVQTEAPPYSYVMVEGPFTISAPEEGQLLHMAVRYLGEKGGKRYAEGSVGDGDSVIVSIRPETWMTVDYSKR